MYSGVTEVSHQAMEHVDVCLCQRPLAVTLQHRSPGLLCGGMLICGTKGVGKSALGRALCREAAGYPNLAFVTVVECKALRGNLWSSTLIHLTT